MRLAHRMTAVAFLMLAPAIAFADEGHGHDDGSTGHEPIPNMLGDVDMDASRGRILFAEKGCVACHSVNGIGGEHAAPLDAHGMEANMSPFDLAAKMWTMAPYMIAAQEEELGEQILFNGQELGDIVAFLHDDAEQHLFTEESLPERIHDMMGEGHGHGSHSD